MTKKERIEALITHYSDGKKGEFANLLGVSAPTISTWISRNTFDIELLFAKCKDLNIEWLLTGRGAMLKEERNIPKESPTLPVSDTTNIKQILPKATKTQSLQEGIPLIPVHAMAGVMHGEVSVMEYEWYVVPAFREAEFLISVKGSSMYPKYSSGDIVACKRVPMTDLFFQWNKVYVLDTNQGALIKRIKPGTDKEHVLVVSENEKYSPFELHLSNIYAVAIVIGVIRLE